MALPSEVVDSSRVPRIGPYSQAVRVGDLVYTAVEVTPELEGKRVVADITLMKDGKFKSVSEPIE